MIEVSVPATTANIGPGFDVLGLALGLYNTVRLEEWGTGLTLRVFNEGSGDIPADENNAVYQAVALLLEKVDYRPRGLYIETVNRIPLGRGLGSSASAIVGGLLAANELVGRPFTREAILNMATDIEGHPDNVAAAIFGGLTICYQTEIGWSALPLRPADSLRALVLIPEEQLATHASRAVLPREVTYTDAIFNIGHAALLVGALMNGRADVLPEATRDRLHQPYREPLVPGLESLTSSIRGILQVGVALSGAGPSIICLTAASQLEDVYVKLKELLLEKRLNYYIRRLDFDYCGARVQRI